MKIDINRACVALILALAGLAHAATSDAAPNTPVGMGAFHGCAALIDFFILAAVSCVLQGSVRTHTQILLFASIAGNVIGWILYLSYVSPVYYNTAMWALTALQIGRLLYVSRGDKNASGDFAAVGTVTAVQEKPAA